MDEWLGDLIFLFSTAHLIKPFIVLVFLPVQSCSIQVVAGFFTFTVGLFDPTVVAVGSAALKLPMSQIHLSEHTEHQAQCSGRVDSL